MEGGEGGGGVLVSDCIVRTHTWFIINGSMIKMHTETIFYRQKKRKTNEIH